MKFTQTSKTIFFAATLACIMPLHGMDKKPWYENYTVYRSVTPLIDSIMTVKSNLLFLYLKIGLVKSNNPTHQQHIVQKKLEHIENKIRKDMNSTIQSLLNDYNVSDDLQSSVAATIHYHKVFSEYYMSQPHAEVIHDSDFSEEIFPILKKNGIHPQSINLINKHKDIEETTATIHVASMMEIMPHIEANNEGQILASNLGAPTLTTYPEFWKYSTENKIAHLSHEIGHLTEHHSHTANMLINFINQIAKTDKQCIESNLNFKKLQTILERQAEILPSLRDSETAAIMRNHRSNEYYPKQLFTNHYAQLAEIDELHKLNARLTNYKPMPIQKIDDLRVMKWLIDPKELKS
jgi:hypothetical protein